MAPEQADGSSESGQASDIYSLGVMLYELITERVPFDGTLVSVLEQLRTAEPPKPSGLRQGVPRDLETICLRCLAKEPERRYSSAEVLREDLERFLRGEPVQARRPSFFERFSRWTTRPERLTDAGAFTLRLNTVVVAWMTFNSVTVLTGQHSSAAIQKQLAGLDERSAAVDSLLIALSTHVPLIWLGLQTIRRRPWAVRAGTVVSAALLAILAASWTEVVPTFGGLYNDPRVRTTIFSMLLLLFSTQFLLYVFAEAACRHRR
jgi:serine/threonine protein kinase